MAATQPRPELLVIVGQTASGKSALGIQVAKEYNGEIISADSWTVYKHFDIGTSKPTISQQKAVKHWLLDAREANEGFNAPAFKEMAENAITNIQNRGKLPILVGGTGLYIDSVLYNFGFLPSVSPDERAKLDGLELAELLDIAKRQNIDLTDIDIRNKRRIIRAIEAKGQKPTRQTIRPNTLVIGLQPDTEELKNRVEHRVDQMLKDGLEQEVKELSVKYGWEAEPLKGIGYREWQAYFGDTQTLEDTRQRIISATNNLAKRQRSWFKRSPDIQWFSSAAQAQQAISSILNN